MAIGTDYNTLKWQDKMFGSFKSINKSITFAGGTTNGIGDFNGTGNPFSLFKVTGNVIMKVIGICTTTLVGTSATLEMGITGSTASIIAQTTATAIDVGEIWHDATPDSGVELASVMIENIVANGADIIGTVATADITAGVIEFICLWKPLTDGSLVEKA